MLNKINVESIVRDHVRTLHITNKRNVAFWDIVLFYVLPALIMLSSMLILGLRVSEGLANALFTGVSIFAGLLFNVQLLIYDNIRHIRMNEAELEAVTKRRRLLFNELFSNRPLAKVPKSYQSSKDEIRSGKRAKSRSVQTADWGKT